MAAEPDAVAPHQTETAAEQPVLSAAEVADLDKILQQVAESHGYVSNLLQTLVLAPAGMAAFAALETYTGYGAKLTDLQRYLASIIAAKDVHYGWAHYAPLAKAAGVTDAQLEMLGEGRIPKDLEPAERAVCAYAFEITAGRRVPPRLAEQMHAHFAPRQIVDLALLTVHAMAVTALSIALEVPTEPPETLAFEQAWRRAKTAGTTGTD